MARAATLALGLSMGLSAPGAAQITLQAEQGAGREGPASLYGSWGTPAQCAAHRAHQREDFSRLAYTIDAQWIQRGPFWCRVTWLAQGEQAGRLQAQALAQCGEDTVRDYRLRLLLEDERLTMRWSKDFTTRALERC